MSVVLGYNEQGELVSVIVHDAEAERKRILQSQFHDIFTRAAARWEELSKLAAAYWSFSP